MTPLTTFIQADLLVPLHQHTTTTTSTLLPLLPKATIIFLYVYPTLLRRIAPVIKSLILSSCPCMRAVVTLAYHVDPHLDHGWPLPSETYGGSGPTGEEGQQATTRLLQVYDPLWRHTYQKGSKWSCFFSWWHIIASSSSWLGSEVP